MQGVPLGDLEMKDRNLVTYRESVNVVPLIIFVAGIPVLVVCPKKFEEDVGGKFGFLLRYVGKGTNPVPFVSNPVVVKGACSPKRSV